MNAHSGPDGAQFLGDEDETAWLCNEETKACDETNIFLTSNPIEEEGVVCELQEGMTMNDGPVWACGKVDDDHAHLVDDSSPSLAGEPSSSARASPPRMGLFDDLVGGAKEAFREKTVQHILVDTQMEAFEIYEAIQAEEDTAAAVGRFASERSTCGSGKKRPDAKMAMLRGQPGELKFRRGSMAKEFEQAAFDSPPGTLTRPFRTQFGYHIMLVND